MLGFLQGVASLKGPTPQTQDIAGAAQDDPSALGSFGALLAQVGQVTETDEVTEDAALSDLAATLAEFRTLAQEGLEEVFPEGEVAPGPEFDDWARDMLSQLDDMLQEIGFNIGDLPQVLASLDEIEGGGLLAEAAEVLTVSIGEEPVVVKEVARVVDETLRPVARGDVGSAAGLVTSVDDLAGVEIAPEIEATGAVETGDLDPAVEPEVDTPDIGQATKPAPAVAPTPEVTPLASAEADTPLPDALRMVLAQVVAAPADRALPAEIQAMLTPQPATQVSALVAAAPVEVSPPPSQPQSNGFARNLAGQIRGVSFSEGTTRIELTPQGLGKLEIEIAPDEAGKLRVVIRAENPAVLNAMRSDREMLAGLLRDGGTSVDDSAMSFEEFGQRGGTQTRGDSGGTASVSGVAAEDDEVTPDVAPTGDGRLNILT